jgi:hypothetical protein
VFTARYALSPYIKQIRFVFKGLKQHPHHRHTTNCSSDLSDERSLKSAIRIQGLVVAANRLALHNLGTNYIEIFCGCLTSEANLGKHALP